MERRWGVSVMAGRGWSTARLMAVVAGVMLATSCGFAQQGAGSEMRMNPLAALRAFEPAANQEYQLGRGDEISIEVNGRPELSRKYVIGPDGRITLPTAGPVLLADKTREQAAELVEDALQPYYTAATVNVSVDKYTSNHVLLLGAVEHPGLMTFDQTPTLLEVISRGGVAGGLAAMSSTTPASNGADGRFINGARPSSIPERCAIYRGADEVMWIDLKGMMDSGNSLADMRLKRDDVVYVPSPADRYVSVLGQVAHPGAIQLDNSTTLQKLLAEAGGLTELAGKNPKIEIFQGSTGKTRVLTMNEILTASKLDLTLHTGDVVYVPESGFNRATYVLQRLSPLMTMFASAAIFAQ